MKKSIILAMALLAFSLAVSAQAKDKYEKYFNNLPFKMQAFTTPTFPQNEVNLKDFGAVGDGQKLCTEAFAKAIDELSRKGGGRLTVPEGVWLTGPIVLKSNINLYVKKGGPHSIEKQYQPVCEEGGHHSFLARPFALSHHQDFV